MSCHRIRDHWSNANSGCGYRTSHLPTPTIHRLLDPSFPWSSSEERPAGDRENSVGACGPCGYCCCDIRGFRHGWHCAKPVGSLHDGAGTLPSGCWDSRDCSRSGPAAVDWRIRWSGMDPPLRCSSGSRHTTWHCPHQDWNCVRIAEMARSQNGVWRRRVAVSSMASPNPWDLRHVPPSATLADYCCCCYCYYCYYYYCCWHKRPLPPLHCGNRPTVVDSPPPPSHGHGHPRSHCSWPPPNDDVEPPTGDFPGRRPQNYDGAYTDLSDPSRALRGRSPGTPGAAAVVLGKMPAEGPS